MTLGVVKLSSIVQYDYVRNPKSTDYVLLYEADDLGFCDRRCWLNFHLLCEVINCDNEELELLPSYREWSHYVDPPLDERTRCDYRRHWLPLSHLYIREVLALINNVAITSAIIGIICILL